MKFAGCERWVWKESDWGWGLGAGGSFWLREGPGADGGSNAVYAEAGSAELLLLYMREAAATTERECSLLASACADGNRNVHNRQQLPECHWAIFYHHQTTEGDCWPVATH